MIDQPAVVVPDEVTHGLQGAQKPHKTGVRATLWKEVERRREEGRQECGWRQKQGEMERITGESHAEGRGDTEGDS